MRKAVVAAGSALVLISGLVPGVSPVGAGVAEAAGSTVQPFDFDGDGFVDLAVGVPGEDLRGRRDAGAVQVLYGSASGVTARDQVWHQGRRGVKGALENLDNFGEVLASGDFDADGYADLAIGVPYEDVGSIRDAGVVQVLYGSSRGLTARDQVWHQGKPGVPGSNERDDMFGSSLAAGDFDADGYADLVIGSPSEDVGSLIDAGRVVVLRGGPRGLTASGALLLRQGFAGVPGQSARWEQFGVDLAVGDVNGDGRDDLAIGASPGAIIDGGSSTVHLLWGSPVGLTSGDVRVITAASLTTSPGITFTLTFADFKRDGTADLVLASVDGQTFVLRFEGNGFAIDRLQVAGQGVGKGLAAAAGDITGDGYPDLVLDGAGDSVQVILGSSAGPVGGVTAWPVPAGEYPDLAVLRLSGGGHAWLAATKIAEAVSVVRGNPDGSAGPVTVWSQDSPGIKGAAEAGDGFGTVIGGSSGAMSQ
jgi:hypothetical protein